MLRHCYLLVEGHHDVAFAGRFLKLRKLKMKNKLAEVSSFWHEGGGLIPRNFPPDSERDIHRRIVVPSFFENDEVSVAIQNGGGLESLPKSLEESLTNLRSSEDLSSIGVLIDADSNKTPEQRFNWLKQVAPQMQMLRALGEVEEVEGVRRGVFVLPNNRDPGTMETVLLQCADAVYPNLAIMAGRYIEEVKRDLAFLRYLSHGSNESKAVIGAMANVFRPGKSNEVSIQDQEWISSKSASVEGVQLFYAFLGALLGLGTSPLKIDPTQD